MFKVTQPVSREPGFKGKSSSSKRPCLNSHTAASPQSKASVCSEFFFLDDSGSGLNLPSRHQHFIFGVQMLDAVCLCACRLSLGPGDSPPHTHFSGLCFLWENTCCCLTRLRTTSSLSPASCNPRLDHFSRFEVNQLQIPLASYRVKIKNRRLHEGAGVRCGSSRLARRYQVFPGLRGIVPSVGRQIREDLLQNTSAAGRALGVYPTYTHTLVLVFLWVFSWKDVGFETPVHCTVAAVSTLPRRTSVCCRRRDATRAADFSAHQSRWPSQVQ